MKSSILFATAGLAGLATAASSPDAQITAAAQLGKHRRQADPALLGYISADGASSCEFPFTSLPIIAPPVRRKGHAEFNCYNPSLSEQRPRMDFSRKTFDANVIPTQ